jgi:SAM-dependent methyltransferase
MHIISQQQWAQDLAKQLVRNLQDNLDWVGVPESTETAQKMQLSLLDYACGTGLVTFVRKSSRRMSAGLQTILRANFLHQALLPWFSMIRGIDISDGNVQKYNQLAHDQGVSPDVIRAIQGDIRSPDSEMSAEDFSGFNAIVISMALHHIDDPKSLLSHLYGRLRPGGHLLVVDWTPEHYGIEVCSP